MKVRKQFRVVFISFFAFIFLFGFLAHAGAENHNLGGKKITVIKGVAVTGLNRLFGQPLWDSGTSYGPIGFNYVFAYDPYAEDPLPLTADTPLNTLLATGLDPYSLEVFGLTPEDFDPQITNLPLRETPIIVERDGYRDFLPSVLDVPAFVPGRSLPNTDITLGKWLQASGRAIVRCSANGKVKLTIQLRGLIKNGIYTVWGAYILDTDNDGVEELMVAPLGGVPNALVADHKGGAVFCRVLNSCPLTDPGLKLIEVMYHSDGALYGAVPNQAFLGYPIGVVTHAQVEFPVNVTPLND